MRILEKANLFFFLSVICLQASLHPVHKYPLSRLAALLICSLLGSFGSTFKLSSNFPVTVSLQIPVTVCCECRWRCLWLHRFEPEFAVPLFNCPGIHTFHMELKFSLKVFVLNIHSLFLKTGHLGLQSFCCKIQLFCFSLQVG